jgi:hypothetical protein
MVKIRIDPVAEAGEFSAFARFLRYMRAHQSITGPALIKGFTASLEQGEAKGRARQFAPLLPSPRGPLWVKP